MVEWTRLAFVDVETTGLSPTEDRIAEIGVVTVEDGCIERWTTLLQPSSRVGTSSASGSPLGGPHHAPRFRDIAVDLARRLDGHLLVAHNARFDYSFLKAEFERAGIFFQPDVVCSVMLSRRLDPGLRHHDMDALVACHALSVEERHRALPDADLVWQLWQVLSRQHSKERIADAIKALLAGPVLPPELDASLIERLPERPGTYVFHGEGHRPLVVGAAGNLKRHVLNYFRIDRATGRACEHAHRVRTITWRTTRGMLGARLQAATLDDVHFADSRRRLNAPAFTLHLTPEVVPCVAIRPLEPSRDESSFGLFATERKARNMLSRLAREHRLCHQVLGIAAGAKAPCLACPGGGAATSCLGQARRRNELVRVMAALWPMRIPPWPHRGPVGIRERSDLHVVDQWQFLGTARCESEVHELLECRARAFDPRLYRLLRRTFSRLPAERIVDLFECSVRPHRAASTSIDGSAHP